MPKKGEFSTGMESGVMDKEFIAEDGIEVTDEMLEEWAAPWERGEVPGTAAGFVSSPGCPCIKEGSSFGICPPLLAESGRECE